MTATAPQENVHSARAALSKLVMAFGVQPVSENSDGVSVAFGGPTAANTVIRVISALRKADVIEGESASDKGNSLPSLMPGFKTTLGSNTTLSKELDGKYKISLTSSAPLEQMTQKLQEAATKVGKTVAAR